MKFKASPAIFLASILCFLLPFITVSCGGQKVGSFSGLQLATGTTVNQPQMFGPAQSEKVESEPMATIAILCAVAGLGLSFLRRRSGGKQLANSTVNATRLTSPAIN